MNDFGLKDEVLEFIIESARENDLDRVVLFGSRASGTYREKSDVDLAYCGGDAHTFEEDIEERCPTLLSFDLVDTSKAIGDSLKNRIAAEGVCIYG